MEFIKKIKADKRIYLFLLALIFCAGVFFRIRAYFLNVPLWLDECSLAINIMHRGLFDFFMPLKHIQSAPPFFMMAVKLVTMALGVSEYSLRLVSLIVSIASVFVFYVFSKKFFNTKLAILFSNFLFAINFRLLYYAEEFKQYASDVLIFMCTMLLINKIDLEKTDFKKAVLYGCALFLLFMCSMPVLFILAAFVIYNLFLRNKKVCINLIGLLLPFICIGPFYYFYNLLPTKKLMFQYFISQWGSGFLNYNPLNLLPVLRDNLHYLFHNPHFMLFGIILFVWGIVLLFKERLKNKISALLLLVLLVAVLASFFNVFPIKERVSLYTIVPFIICIIKPLDSLSVKKKFASAIALILAVLFFCNHNFSYLKTLCTTQFIENKKDGRAIMQIMVEKFQPGEIVVYNDATNSIYDFYSEYCKLNNDKFIIINLPKYSREYYISLLEQLPKGHTYWFYYANDYVKMPVVKFIKEWAQDKQVLETHEINGSFLMHIKL